MVKKYDSSQYLHTLERSQLLRKRLKEVNDLKLTLLADNEFQGFMTRTLKKVRRRTFLLLANASR